MSFNRVSIATGVAGIAGAVFCVLLIYLALQMRAGSDPAIGAGQQTAAAPRQVIVRRIIVTRVVEDDDAPAADGATPAARTPAASAPSAAQPPAAAPAAPATAAPPPVMSRGS